MTSEKLLEFDWLPSILVRLETIAEGGRYRDAAKRATERRNGTARHGVAEGKRNAEESSPSCEGSGADRETKRGDSGEARASERERKAANGYRRSLSVPLLRKVTND